MSQRLLAIDPGSHDIAFAYYVDGAIARTDLIRPKASLPWLERLHYVGAELQRGSSTRGWQPDVVAIEETYVHHDPRAAITMGKTSGYIARVIHELYPQTRWLAVAKAPICHALGLKGNARRVERQKAARDRFPQLASQDEADAAAVGLAAMKLLEEGSS